MARRPTSDLLLGGASAACMALALCGLFAMLWMLASQSAGLFSAAFFLEPNRGDGTVGGVRYQLLGTLILTLVSTLTAATLALGAAIGMMFYVRITALRNGLANFALSMGAMPGIVWGILGVLVLGDKLGLGKSWSTGASVLALMICPTILFATLLGIRSVSRDTLDAARALGLSRETIIWQLIIPRCRRHIVSGTLLSVARAAGETSAVMMTAAVFSGATVPTGLRNDPVATLSYHIFVLTQDHANALAQAFAWSTVSVVLCINLAFVGIGSYLRIWSPPADDDRNN